MASISTNKTTGHKRVLIDLGEKRVTVYLGKVSLKDAESFRYHIENLAGWKFKGRNLLDDTAVWLNGRGAFLRSKLEKAGIVDPIHAEPKPEKPVVPLGNFVKGYIKGRADIKLYTRRNLTTNGNYLIEYFGADRDIASIHEGHADEYKQSLLRKGLAENTTRRAIAVARQLFKVAIRHRHITDNPFAGLPCALRENKSRHYFLSPKDSEKVLAACPDSQWRLLFSLCRWGGLRNPSETLLLRWDDIDFEHNRIHVSSPKTERHCGHESRVIPLFPELLKPLLEANEQAEPGAVFVISRYRDTTANHRTQFTRILKRAGLKPWPKMFQNLRSTRETELAGQFPIHVVCAWIGNSVLIAKKSYLQIRDEDFDAAVSGDENPSQSATRKTTRATQKTTQNIAEQDGREKIVSREFISQVYEDSGLIGNPPNPSDSRHFVSTADKRS
jgi:integrase